MIIQGGCASTSTKAVIITHGWNAHAFGWVIEMAWDMCNRLGATLSSTDYQPNGKGLVCSGNGWDVWVYDWSARADLEIVGSPESAWRNAGAVGDHVGTYFKGLNQYQHFHLIAHSAGSHLIDHATPILRSSGDTVTVHATFLDAYDPKALAVGGRHISLYGKNASVVDSYVDTRNLLSIDISNPLNILIPDHTNLRLVYGYNINVTPPYNGDGCILMPVSPDIPVCRHDRPIRFYGKSVNTNFVGDSDSMSFDPIYSTADMGFNFSVENGKSINTLQIVYPDSHECSVGSDDICHPVVFSPSTLYFLPGAMVNTVVTAAVGSANYVVGIVDTVKFWTPIVFDILELGVKSLLPGASATVKVAKSVSTATSTSTATESPSWVVVNVTTTEPVNTLRFNWRFNSAGEGLLRIYVDDTSVREIDQRHVPLASLTTEEVYVGGDSGTLAPGTHKITFRLDGFGANASGVELTNVELGLVKVVTTANYTLTVVKAGAGSGTVTSNLAGIACGVDCSESYASGTVTLTATPTTGSTFAGWSGGGCTGTASCVVTMDTAKSVTATFNATVQRAFVASYGLDSNTAFSCNVTHPCRTFAHAGTVVSTDGEVVALNSAGYGLVTPIRSVSLMAAPGVYAGISVFSGASGVTIATPGVNVVLRGLTINGQGGDSGVSMFAGAKLSIENCVISNFNGINQHGIFVNTGATVRIVDTLIRDNSVGIGLQGGATADISKSKFLGNNNSILVQSVAAMTTTAAISNTVVTGGGTGIEAFSGTSGNARINVVRSAISNNTVEGIVASATAGTASITLNKSMVSGNAIGFYKGTGGTLNSLGNNTITDNSSNTGTLTLITPK